MIELTEGVFFGMLMGYPFVGFMAFILGQISRIRENLVMQHIKEKEKKNFQKYLEKRKYDGGGE